jgi:hypothetical protein
MSRTHALSDEMFPVVHPLKDQPEQKCGGGAALTPMAMSRPVRISLLVLRTYLLAMVALVAWRMLEMTVLAHH